MASVFIRHRVVDSAKWKPFFDDHEPARRAAGLTTDSLHREADDPNVVIIAFRASDVNRANEWISSDDLRSVMARAGVQGQPEIWFAEDIEE